MSEPTTLHTVAQCNLWTAVYASAMATGLTPEFAVEHADLAVAAMTARMPPIATLTELNILNDAIADLRAKFEAMQAAANPTPGGEGGHD